MQTPFKNQTPSSSAWPKLGLGTGTLASLGRKSSLPDVIRLLEAMTETGSTLIDTADSYGSGDCEFLIGKALRVHGGAFHIVTKAGYRLSNLPGPLRPLNQFAKKAMQRLGERQRFDPAYLRRSLDDSLSRLKVSKVDAFLLHDPKLEILQNGEVLKTCQSLKESGKAASVGVSSGDPLVIRAALSSGIFSVIQTPANMAVVNSLRGSWEECANHDVHLIGNHVYSPGCLQLPGMNHETLMRACASYLPVNSTILCGTRRPAHLTQSAAWAREAMPPAQTYELLNRFFPTTGEAQYA